MPFKCTLQAADGGKHGKLAPQRLIRIWATSATAAEATKKNNY